MENKKNFGRVKHFNRKAGWGFILDHKTRQTIFFSKDDFIFSGMNEITNLDELSYDVIEGHRGPRAKNITPYLIEARYKIETDTAYTTIENGKRVPRRDIGRMG